jgi:photosystem II stability/assembly factor-like uncharacterized protein
MAGCRQSFESEARGGRVSAKIAVVPRGPLGRKLTWLVLPVTFAMAMSSCTVANATAGRNVREPPGSALRVVKPALVLAVPMLTSVTCPTVAFCLAAGKTRTGAPLVIGSDDRSHLWARFSTGPFVGDSVITQVACPTRLKCYAVGYVDGRGAIATSNDGGRRWTKATASPESPDTISCASSRVCTVLASGLWRTTDGGKKWTRQLVGRPNLYALSCPTRKRCMVLAAGVSTNEIYVSSDGGQSWAESRMDLSPALPALSCGSATNCVMVSAQRAQSTDDFGTTWTQHRLAPQLGLVACRDRYCLADTGIVLGGLSAAQIFASADGGRTWTERSNPLGKWSHLQALSCWSPGHCLIVAMTPNRDADEILRTNDGGAHWSTRTRAGI